MSTPTPSQLAAFPSPAAKKPGLYNSVSTPAAHNLSSPAPRSVPSPAATRKDLSGKTPIGHGTNGSSTGSKTVAGTPMMLNLSQQGSTMSPMLAGLTPIGLGVDLGTPGHLNIATPALGTGMMPTLSDLGLTASGGLKRNEEEERRTKMRKILKAIGRPKGRVSEEGILRVSRRLGLANDIDGEYLKPEERERRVGNRTIGIAGNTLVVEVDMRKHVPTEVRVDFSNNMANAAGRSEQAASILLNDLKPQQPHINKMLDRFAHNLERLTKLDRLSTPKISCFGALSGLYVSLKRLYDQELALALELYTDESTKDTQAETRVINSGNGRPAMHEDDLTGLSLTYWREPRTVHKDPGAMDIDGLQDELPPKHKIYFETERCPSGLFPPIRITDAWLPDPLVLAGNDETASIPWQNPPLTYVSQDTDGVHSMADDTSQSLPDIRFVAKLDPPLILPWQVAANLFTAVQSSIPPAFQLPSYLALLLDLPSGIPGNLLTTHAQVLRPSEDGFVDVLHKYKINVTKFDLGYRLEELPFSHPRQIVELLPVLRQWLGINTLLLRHLNAATPSVANQKTVVNRSLLDSLLTNTPSGEPNELSVECVLLLAPNPTLSLTFALSNGNLHNTDVQVLPNGVFHVIGADSGDEARALNLCNDLGVWIEWLRARRRP